MGGGAGTGTYVDTTNAQTIAGIKTFSQQVTVSTALRDTTINDNFSTSNLFGTSYITNTNTATTILSTDITSTASTGTNTIKSTSGLVEVSTTSTNSSGILIKNNNTTTGGIRIENEGASGLIVLDTTSGGGIELRISGDDKLNISGVGAAQATVLSGALTTVSGTTLTLGSTTGGASLTATTGVVSVNGANTTAAGVLLENTSVTGGVTVRSNGSNGITLNSINGTTTLTTNSSSATAISLRQTGLGGISIITSTSKPIVMGTTVDNYATVSGSGVGATSYWTGYGGVNTYNLLSFQIHATKNASGGSGSVLIAPCYNFTTTDKTFNYCLPVPIVFTKMTLIYDTDAGAAANMTFDFIRKTSNAGTPSTIGTEVFATTTNATTTYTQVITLPGYFYDVGEIFKVDYSGSPANEWGVIFHGYQVY